MIIIENSVRNAFITLCKRFSEANERVDDFDTKYSKPEWVAEFYRQSHIKNRLQCQSVTIEIDNPLSTEEIEGIPSKGIGTIWSKDQANNYYVDLLNPATLGYVYTYGERINYKPNGHRNQLEECVQLLSQKYTNNAQIVIARPDDFAYSRDNWEQLDKPCLQLIDFKRTSSGLNMSTYWRSHSIPDAWPQMISFGLFQAHVAELCDLKVGKMFVYESGLHVRAELMPLVDKIAKYLQPIGIR